MAKSCLAELDGQLRFLSKFFLEDEQVLNHGLQIIARHLDDSSDNFVNDLTEKHRESNHVMFQDVIQAISAVFPEDRDRIVRGYVRMLAYDAIVGNHDRHYYNWGVITDPRDLQKPRFSPIFDSARGCFWNHSEDTASEHFKDHMRLAKYARKCDPLVGYEGQGKVNHFKLVGLIAANYPEFKPVLLNLYQPNRLPSLAQMIDREFSQLLTVSRRNLIFKYLALRLTMYGDAVR